MQVLFSRYLQFFLCQLLTVEPSWPLNQLASTQKPPCSCFMHYVTGLPACLLQSTYIVVAVSVHFLLGIQTTYHTPTRYMSLESQTTWHTSSTGACLFRWSSWAKVYTRHIHKHSSVVEFTGNRPGLVIVGLTYMYNNYWIAHWLFVRTLAELQQEFLLTATCSHSLENGKNSICRCLYITQQALWNWNMHGNQ